MPIDRERLIVKLEADSSRLQSELDKSQKKLKRYGNQAKRTKKMVSDTFKGMAAKLALPVLTAGFVALTKKQLDYIDSLQKLEDRLGASTEALSEYRYVAELSGVQFRTLTMGWQRMTRRIAEAAKGMGEAKGALKELGLSARELNQLSPDQQFERIADAISKVGNQSDKVRLAMKLFDSEGVALLQTMKGGSEAMKAQREEAKKLGASIGGDLAEEAAKAKDALAKMDATVEALITRITSKALPVIEFFTQRFKALNSLIGEDSQEQKDAKRVKELEQRIQKTQELIENAQYDSVKQGHKASLDRLWKEYNQITDKVLKAEPVKIKTTIDENQLKESMAMIGKDIPAIEIPAVVKYKVGNGVYSDGSVQPSMNRAAEKVGSKR